MSTYSRQIYPCPACPRKTFGTAQALRTHCQVKHSYCQQCRRYFATFGDLKTHYAKEYNHPSCDRCGEGFMDNTALMLHKTAAHPTIRCEPCRQYINERQLEQHWKDSPNHPTCRMCAKGFETHVSYQQHALSSHREVCCATCGIASFTVEGLHQHYFQSPLHPHCLACKLGFKNHEAFQEHNTSRHPPPPANVIRQTVVTSQTPTPAPSPFSCSVCCRSFRIGVALQAHFRDSSIHPTCASCNIGFLDDAAYDQHVATKHAQVSRQPSPLVIPRRSNEPVLRPPSFPQVVITPPTASPLRPATSIDSSSISSSCDTTHSHLLELQRSEVLDDVEVSPRASSEPVPVLSTVHTGRPQFITVNPQPSIIEATSLVEPSPDDVTPPTSTLLSQQAGNFSSYVQDGQDTGGINTSSSTPELIRSLSPTESSVSSVTASSVRSEFAPMDASQSPQSASRSPQPSSGLRSFENVQNEIQNLLMQTGPRNDGDMDMSTVNQRSSRPASRISRRSSRYSSPQSWRNTITAAGPPSSHSHSEFQHRSPIERPGSSNRGSRKAESVSNASQISGSGGRMSRMSSRPAVSIPASTPRTQSRLSNHFDSSRAEDGTWADRTAGTAGDLADPEEEENANSSPGSKTPTMVAPPNNASVRSSSTNEEVLMSTKAVSWHCRICLKDTTDPTVTICGHLFCHGCIVQELARNFQCPVCKKMMLLRLHVETM
ncbi:hypothetical protein C8Q75DRAFT_115966 [Abortiporus biennis]|nr:hypothetical protein C8Q75DRAFT_115966 [Abortiporus biennis]